MSATEELPPPRTRREMKERGILLTTEIPVVPEPPGWDEAVAAGTWVGEEAAEPEQTDPSRRGRHATDVPALDGAPADDAEPAGAPADAAEPDGAPAAADTSRAEATEAAAPAVGVATRRAIHRPPRPTPKIPRIELAVRTAGIVFVFVVVAVVVFLISNGSLGSLLGGDQADAGAAAAALVGARALGGSGVARHLGRRDR